MKKKILKTAILLLGSLLLWATFTAQVLAAPANDHFVNATEISGRSGSVQGNNSGATIEPGEPFHGQGGYGDRHSVWWKWTAPVNGTATFTANGSTYYPFTVLAAYTGSAVNELTMLDGGLAQIKSPEAVFSVTRGTTYYIVVSDCSYYEDEFGYGQGNIKLNWNVEMQVPQVYAWPQGHSTYGDALATVTLAGGSASVPGNFVFENRAFVPAGAGEHSVGVKFVPDDQYTYDTVSGNATVTVQKAPLTIRADNKSKTYGDSDPYFTATYSGLKRGDTSAVVSGLVYNRVPGENVGSYTITPSGAMAQNYTISYESGTLTVEKAPLTIRADNKSKTYGDGDPVFTATCSGFKLGDTAAVLSGLGFSRAPGENVGGYAITPSGATAQNYTLSYETGTLTIEKAPLTIKAVNKSKTYGDDDPEYTAVYSGFKFADTAAVLSGLVFSRTPGENVGGYAITPYGATAQNYLISYEMGTLTIEKAPLVITAEDKSKTYGDGDPEYTAVYSGFKFSDTAAVLSGLVFNRTAGENVGEYTITPSGATAQNYLISYETGRLSINKAPLVIRADNKSKTYGDGDPVFTATCSGFKLGDTAAVLSGLGFSRAPGENVGGYAITPSGATAQNYTLKDRNLLLPGAIIAIFCYGCQPNIYPCTTLACIIWHKLRLRFLV